MKILTPEQMREVDRLTTEAYGIPSIILMENAGMRVVEIMTARFEKLLELEIVILCGKGNNGGDGLVIARQLVNRGCFPLTFLFAGEDELSGDTKTNLTMLKAIGYPPTVVRNEAEWEIEKSSLVGADVVVDSLLGTGAKTPVRGLYQAVVESLVEEAGCATILSVDVPTPGVEADLTVTFSAPKPSLIFPPDCAAAGEVIVVEIGNPSQLLRSDKFKLNLIEASVPPSRQKESHKGVFGNVLVVGGSRGKSGAAAMVGQAALRAGAGLVTVAAPASVLPVIASSMPELMTEPLEETAEGFAANTSISALLEGKTVLALGPGLTTFAETTAFVRSVAKDAKSLLVIDADGLNAFAGHDSELPAGCIITPHAGEMARLIGKDVGYVTANRIEVAQVFAESHQLYVVLKGFRTLVATPDGAIHVNPTGNPGMATAGCGDVLTGIIAGILGQEDLGAFIERLNLAVYLHGLSGDLAAEELGEESMVATDLLRFLPKAWLQLRN